MRLLTLLLLATLALHLAADRARAVERGTWFWYQSSDPYGAANIVGNAAREAETISFLKQWQITRLYGSYSNLTSTDAPTVAAWNKKLAQNGIQSYVMISSGSHGLAQNRAGALSLVDSRLINFNAARSDPQERFAGLEMDIEIWTTPEWEAATTGQRRNMMYDFATTLAAMRQRVDNAGQSSAKLSAALAFWFETTNTITWNGASDVDQWFADIGQSLDEISVMAYATNNPTTIVDRSAYEISHFPGNTYVAMRTRPDLEWASMDQFYAAMNSVEGQTNSGIDIENYYRWQGVIPEPSALALASIAATAAVLRRRRRRR